MKKAFILSLLIVFFFVIHMSSAHAQTTIPFSCADAKYAASPVCKGEHPRLHITKATLPYYQNKVATIYKSEYQQYVKEVEKLFGTTPAGGKSDRFALVYLLGTIPGITYKYPLNDYGLKAIEFMLAEANKNQNLGAIRGPQYFGSDFAAAIARTYDWTYSLQTLSQKSQMINWFADQGTAILAPGSNFQSHIGDVSSTYFEEWHPWILGLAFYNDGERQTDAQTLLDSFATYMLNGNALDMQNWVARSRGGNSEPGDYEMFHPIRHIINIDSWRTTTGQNYFAEGTSIAESSFVRYYPQFVLYRLKPAHSINPTRIVKWGESFAGQGFNTNGEGGDVMHYLVEPLKTVDPAMASLQNWMMNTFNIQPAHITDTTLFMQLLFDDKSAILQSPTALNLPLTRYFEGLGMVIMRTGFSDVRDTMIAVGAPTYQLGGHGWANDTSSPTSQSMMPIGFSIDKYGPLVFKRNDNKHGPEHRHNLVRFIDPLNTPHSGLLRAQNGPGNVTGYTVNSKWDRIGVTRLWSGQGYDYVSLDMTRNYDATRVKKYTRHVVYFRPQKNTDVDYVVMFDRTESVRPDIEKRWEVNMAYDPVINGQEAKLRDGKWEYAWANEIAITNDVDPDPYSGKSHPEAHGKLFIKTLLPQSVKLVKVGGPGHEFENDAGVIEGSSASVGDALFTGTYFVDVIPTSQNTKDNFLHVLQTADTNNPTQSSSMIPTSFIESQEGNMQGAFIASSQGQDNAIVMFAKEEVIRGATDTMTYTIPSIASKGNSLHIIADLPMNVIYDIYVNGKKTTSGLIISDLRTSHAKARGETGAGTLSFTTNIQAGDTIQIIPTGVSIPTIAPPTPTLIPPIPTPTSPLITLTKSVDKTTVLQGDTLTYTLSYINTSITDAQNLTITDVIPQGTTYVQGSATGTPTFDGTKLTWTISKLKSSESGSVLFQVRVD